ncbi:hsp70-binding protein 1-like isoform X2 [Babylonia areolata]
MAEDNSDGQGQRPGGRQPKDLQGLLKFCVENTKAEDAPEANREMSPERKEWLSQALDGMRRDPVQEVKEHIRAVGVYLGSQSPSDQARSDALHSLEELFDWCESLDMAMDFVKIGGMSILHELLTHSDPEVRRPGFQLVGALVQNHRECQEAAVRGEVLPTMLRVLHTEQDPEVQCTALQAISCLVRDSSVEEAREQFLSHQGFEVLRKVLQSPGPFKRVVKIAFFLDVLCRKHPQYKDMVCESGMVELLAQEVSQGEHQQSHEHLMSALLRLATDHPPTQQLLARPHLHMTSVLRDRVTLLTGREENEEERAYAEKLLQIIQSSSSLDGCMDLQ